jgi:hypothetical protein
MSTSNNPSYMLMNRNPPLPAHPQLFPQSTPRHSASTSNYHARQLSAPNLPSEAVHLYPVPETTVFTNTAKPEIVHQDDLEEDEEIDVHPTFSRYSSFKGRVKVIVGKNEFWCHKEILWFASPFFQGLLQGR